MREICILSPLALLLLQSALEPIRSQETSPGQDLIPGPVAVYKRKWRKYVARAQCADSTSLRERYRLLKL